MTAPALPVSVATVDRWIRLGLLRLERTGSGRRRDYPPEELRAFRAVHAVRQLGGTDGDGQTMAGPVLDLCATVAELARTNQPGTVHEITSPVPWIRHVLVVS